jgi:hypothetical protein
MAGTISLDIWKLLTKRLGKLAPLGPIHPQLVDERDD